MSLFEEQPFYCQRNIAGVYPKTTPSSLLPGFLFSTSPSLAIQACLLFLNLLTNKKIIPFALLLLWLLLITINCYCVYYCFIFYDIFISYYWQDAFLHTIQRRACWAYPCLEKERTDTVCRVGLACRLSLP